MRILALLFALIVVLSSARAGDLKTLPIAQCEFMVVMSTLQMESIQRSALTAKQSKPLLNQLEQLMSKAKKPGVPIGEQLAGGDLATFGRLTQQMAAVQLAQLIESHRQRDLRVLAQFVQIADQEYRWHKVPTDGEQDYMPYVILAVMREVLPNLAISTPNDRVCSLEYALHQIEAPTIEVFNRTGLAETKVVLDRLGQRYKERPLDGSKMSAADAAAYERAMEVFGTAGRHLSFIRDIERLKLLARAADLNAEAKAQDLTFAGGDIKKIGSTLDAMMAAGQLNDEMQTALKLWFSVNDRIPSDVSKMFQKLGTSPSKQ